MELLARSGTFYTPTLLVSYGGPWGEQYFWQTMNPHDDPKLQPLRAPPLARRLRPRHVWISPDEYHFPIVARGAADVARAGGNVSIGAHGQLQGLGPHWEMWGCTRERAGTPGVRP